jgi:predicted flap endonuclease-1-like 5' DNA nuclease
MTYPISDIRDIGPEEAAMLRKLGIRSTNAFLEAAATLKGRKHLHAETGIPEEKLLKWANHADRLRIKGMGAKQAELLQEIGVVTVRELRHRNAKRLAEAIRAANGKRLRLQILPSERATRRWIEQAQKLPLKISY